LLYALADALRILSSGLVVERENTFRSTKNRPILEFAGLGGWKFEISHLFSLGGLV
jgi:hypothetical protein